MKPEVTLSDQLIAEAIDGAEEISDPLVGLAQKTAADPGAPFVQELAGGNCGPETGQPLRL